MNEELIRKVVDIARWYPSGDNCQPFRYRYDNEQLFIDYKAESAKHALIYNNDLILMTLGFAIEYLRNAFGCFQVNCQFEMNLNQFSFNKDCPAICRFILTNAEVKKLPNIDAITLSARVTDRRKFIEPKPNVKELVDYLKDYHTTHCTAFYNAPKHILRFFSLCDSRVWASNKLGMDIMNSVTFDEPPKRTGLPWRNLGLSKFETYPIKWIQKYNRLFDVFAALGSSKAMMKSQLDLWQSSKSFLIFSLSQESNAKQIVEGSMEMLNYLLRLTKLGYHFQPSTLSTLVLNYPLQTDINLQSAAGVELDNLSEQIKATRDFIGLPSEKIQWVIRFGKTERAVPEQNRTLRLTVDELLTKISS